MKSVITNKGTRLFIILGGFFITNALIAEFVGVKIFSLEAVFGMEALNMTLFGQSGLGFSLTAGVLLWPVVFVMTDVINEYYGKRGVRMLSFLAVAMIAYAFFMIYFAVSTPPDQAWADLQFFPAELQEKIRPKVTDYNFAFGLVFQQGLWIIIGSLVAFLIGQFVDVLVFHRIKRVTGEGKVWLRATGSTLVSQFIDSYVVLFIAFYLGADWPLVLVLAIGTVNYIYKFAMAVILTPVIYLAHSLIDNYLGEELARKMKADAQNS